ncbi:16S rRNA m(2)G 1207 methyltransferase [Luteibacter rhizovicinus]|uniref:16S rRNA m(2)G 1207 methyltransferase n=1 Tax=Luteibacter rhizovicinus TaxID=242606 RepID=A0A4R3YPV9_9GAMM|nr:class I SAM-dependent methyltransferase [Luteibacter rhizovicinus]TCV93214.1 16S rRNA m(2)G 1207 methyltransferase [Luteibacter rhizovicinus]
MAPGLHSDVALDALFVPFDTGDLRFPADGRVLFLRARDGFRARELRRPGWVMQQSFRPFADALERSGFDVVADAPDEVFPLVLVLPTRQREETRALFARALRQVAPGGIVVASVPNAEGARTAESDLTALAGGVTQISKHKCRVFWTRPGAIVDDALMQAWLALDEPVRIAGDRFVSRRGLFAWDRIDVASALLAEVLPSDLSGTVADLGAGFGYLSCEVLDRCAAVTDIDLYEAEARALQPARMNVEAAVARHDRPVRFDVLWRDVTAGLDRRYHAIVSNPPFHQGRADQPELGRAFIERAADALVHGGVLWMVANRHLPYESTLAARFVQVRTVIERDGFKVIEARGVR